MEYNFSTESNNQLIKRYNDEVGKKGWGNARAQYLSELAKELRNRKLEDYLIFPNGNLNLSRQVRLIDNQIIIKI